MCRGNLQCKMSVSEEQGRVGLGGLSTGGVYELVDTNVIFSVLMVANVLNNVVRSVQVFVTNKALALYTFF